MIFRCLRHMPKLFALAVVAFGTIVRLSFANFSVAAPNIGASASVALSRRVEPIIMPGLFAGVPIPTVFVYRYTGSAWEQIPFQVDEVDAAGSYVASEDGLMDANDELVLMSSDLGVIAPEPPNIGLPIEGFWYTVRVINPLVPGEAQMAYVVRSATLTATNTTDYVSFDTQNRQLHGTDYSIGWAPDSDHAGLDRMTIGGGADILDRTKIRVRTVGVTLTENDLPKPALTLVKDGPVRVIATRGAATTFGYRSVVDTLTILDLSSISGVNISELRLSTDLANTIGTATFYDENIPTGVVVDGVADMVPSVPFTAPWRQVSTASGSFIQLVSITGAGGTAQHYYKDDSTFDTKDTGDQQSYGDGGITVVDPTGKVISVQTRLFFLVGTQPNRGTEFNAYRQTPLTVIAAFDSVHHTYLPAIGR